LTWNVVTGAGSVVVNDEIKIHCEMQLVKKADDLLKINMG
jgi:hypothetical protein